MNILHINQYFLTSKESGGTRSYWITKELVEKGHHVTMRSSSIKYPDALTKVTIDGLMFFISNKSTTRI